MMSFGSMVDGLLRAARELIEGRPAAAPGPTATPYPEPPQPPIQPGDWLKAPRLQWRGNAFQVLLERLFSADAAASEGAARKAADALRGLSAGALVRLDQDVRKALTRWGVEYRPGAHVKPPMVAALRLPEGTEAEMLGLLSMYWDGYVREAAVHRLAEIRDGSELRYLLLRAGDWVLPIRALAERRVRERLTPRYAPRFVAALGLLPRLVTGRASDSTLPADVERLLRTPEALPALREGLASPDAVVRRAAFPLFAAAPGVGAREAVETGLASPNPVVRRMAAREARRLDAGDAAELLPAMMGDSECLVRAQAVSLAEGLGEAGRDALDAALFDSSALVRLFARAALKKAGVADFAARYRAALAAGGKRRPGALAGLGETGSTDDLPLLYTALDDPSARVRVEAARAALALGRDAAVPRVSPLLADATPRVSRTVRNALGRRAVDPSYLATLFAADRPPHVRRNALALLGRRQKWDAIVWLLPACADADGRVAHQGRQLLRRWRERFNRSYQTPTPAQLARIAELLDAAGEAIDEDTREWMRKVALRPG